MPETRSSTRKQAISNILEKGIIYFFFRGRVDIDQPSGVKDIARTYFLLRPIEEGAKLGDGPIGDAGNARLCAIPKKKLPHRGRDRWIAFVEKAGVSFAQLKEEFLSGKEYETKTAGPRHTPPATPAGEGVYAIMSVGRKNCLAYILTLPRDLGEVQTMLGLRERGNFIISTRNPLYSAPRNAQIPGGPKYPQEIQDEFRSLRWIPTKPKHLDVVGSQILLVGSSHTVDEAMEPHEEGEKDEKDENIEEMESLEDEDLHRMEHLGEDDTAAIFTDLDIHAKDYPKLQREF